MKFSIIIIWLWLAICLSNNAYAQFYQKTVYTIKDGLPSNSLYKTLIDKRGFLWMSSENGVIRFDGKTFKTYDTKSGLKENEVIDLQMEQDGTIWAMPFRKKPTFYNENTDRFEDTDTNLELQKLVLGNGERYNLMSNGGIAFAGANNKYYVVKQRKVIYADSVVYKKLSISKMIELEPNHFVVVCTDSIRYVKNGVVYKTKVGKKEIFLATLYDKDMYYTSGNTIEHYQITNSGDFILNKTKIFPFAIRVFCYTGKRFAICSNNGYAYMLNKQTLALEDNIINNLPIRNIVEDNNNNIWVSTKDEGLYKLQNQKIYSYDYKPELLQEFSAISYTNKLLLGNNKGEIALYDKLYTFNKVAVDESESIDKWVRKIIDTKYGYIVSSQTRTLLLSKNLSTTRLLNQNINIATKTAVLLNDSVLLGGNHAFLFFYNLKTERIYDSISCRISAIGINKTEEIYYGSYDGLYKYANKAITKFGATNANLTYKVNTILCMPNNIVFVGMGADYLIVLKDDKEIAKIPLGKLIPGNNCRVLKAQNDTTIWLGTNAGLNKITYKFVGGKFEYKTNYFNSNDGLLSNQINDVVIKNDTIYVATAKGLNYFAANTQLPVNELAVYISRVRINDVDTVLQHKYSLPYSSSNIELEFAAADLSGYVPLFEYRINGNDWITTDRNTIDELKRLNPGNYVVEIRAIKRDNEPSQQITKITFYIRTPFWRSKWFWFILIGAFSGAIIYYIQKNAKERQRKAFEKIFTEKKIVELEMQSLKAQINPHFVFNCLNSIKGLIYQKDYKQADIYLDKFADLFRNTLDNSSSSLISIENEIAYLKNYLELEQFRFTDKFDFIINVDALIDKQKVHLPSMLLQPYVENAIRHGIRFLNNKQGYIEINIVEKTNYIEYTIDDNGIGREAAQLHKKMNHIEYQSRGMQISNRRAQLYNIEQITIDKKNDAGLATGTTIVLNIPKQLN